jgi:hypothetical protein
MKSQATATAAPADFSDSVIEIIGDRKKEEFFLR